MASDPFIIWTDEVLTVAGLAFTPVAGVPYTLASTPEQSNSPVRDSLLVDIEYDLITPDITAGAPPFLIGAVVESKDGAGHWHPKCYQFNPIRNSEDAPARTLRMQPNISDFNAGIDDSMFPLNKETARISRHQGSLPDQAWRICIVVVDNDPQGPNGLGSCRVSISGERYDSAG